jgi:hypothetical protein
VTKKIGLASRLRPGSGVGVFWGRAIFCAPTVVLRSPEVPMLFFPHSLRRPEIGTVGGGVGASQARGKSQLEGEFASSSSPSPRRPDSNNLLNKQTKCPDAALICQSKFLTLHVTILILYHPASQKSECCRPDLRCCTNVAQVT